MFAFKTSWVHGSVRSSGSKVSTHCSLALFLTLFLNLLKLFLTLRTN